jgi:hypothetical protein
MTKLLRVSGLSIHGAGFVCMFYEAQDTWFFAVAAVFLLEGRTADGSLRPKNHPANDFRFIFPWPTLKKKGSCLQLTL